MLHPSVYENPELLWVWLLLGFGAGALCHLSLSLSRWAGIRSVMTRSSVSGTADAPVQGASPQAESVAPASAHHGDNRCFAAALGVILVSGITLLASHHHLSVEVPGNALRKYQRHAGVFVLGDMPFQKAIGEALALLETAAPDKFDFVRSRIWLIVKIEGPETSGTALQFDPPFVALNRDVMRTSNLCAATLVHEAMHIELMRRAQKKHNGGFRALDAGGILAEVLANRIACETLRQIGDPENIASFWEREGGAHGEVCEKFALQYPDVYWPRPLGAVYPELWKRLQDFRESIQGKKAGDEPGYAEVAKYPISTSTANGPNGTTR
jgi:hypothetical protein